MVTGAIRTDFILSAEIMVIALNEVADQAFLPRLIILAVVAVVITVVVYGVVAVIVKMDDIGLSLAQRSSKIRTEGWPRTGHRDAQAALGTLGDRHGGDALGGRPHPARRDSTTSAGTRRTASFTTGGGRTPRTPEASAACSPGWSTPGRPRWSAWSSAPWSSRSCTCFGSVAEKSTPLAAHARPSWVLLGESVSCSRKPRYFKMELVRRGTCCRRLWFGFEIVRAVWSLLRRCQDLGGFEHLVSDRGNVARNPLDLSMGLGLFTSLGVGGLW